MFLAVLNGIGSSVIHGRYLEGRNQEVAGGCFEPGGTGRLHLRQTAFPTCAKYGLPPTCSLCISLHVVCASVSPLAPHVCSLLFCCVLFCFVLFLFRYRAESSRRQRPPWHRPTKVPASTLHSKRGLRWGRGKAQWRRLATVRASTRSRDPGLCQAGRGWPAHKVGFPKS